MVSGIVWLFAAKALKDGPGQLGGGGRGRTRLPCMGKAVTCPPSQSKDKGRASQEQADPTDPTLRDSAQWKDGSQATDAPFLDVQFQLFEGRSTQHWHLVQAE